MFALFTIAPKLTYKKFMDHNGRNVVFCRTWKVFKLFGFLPLFAWVTGSERVK